MCLLNYVRISLSIIFLVLSNIGISNSSLHDGTFSCKQDGHCRCTGNDGVIDLSPLVNSSQPLIASTNTKLYMYHPCSDVPLNTIVNSTCLQSYGLCYFVPSSPTDKPVDYNKAILNETIGSFSRLAINNEAVFRFSEAKEGVQLEIVYKHFIGKGAVTTTVKLQCSEDHNYKLTIEKSETWEHVLVLSTSQACLPSNHHMSGAGVFFLIILIFFVVYFVGGIVVLKYIRGATGVEMIPNHEFWCKLSQSVKDGVMYLATCGKSTPDSYEKI